MERGGEGRKCRGAGGSGHCTDSLVTQWVQGYQQENNAIHLKGSD